MLDYHNLISRFVIHLWLCNGNFQNIIVIEENVFFSSHTFFERQFILNIILLFMLEQIKFRKLDYEQVIGFLHFKLF